jgi:hypothetical protein
LTPTNSSNYFSEIKERVVKIGAGRAHSWALTKKGNLYLWGFNEHFPHRFYPQRKNVPKLLEGRKFMLPGHWKNIFLWIFSGRTEKNSDFSLLPVEVLLEFVGLRLSI